MDDTAADDESITPDDDNAVAKDGHTYGQTAVWMDRSIYRWNEQALFAFYKISSECASQRANE